MFESSETLWQVTQFDKQEQENKNFKFKNMAQHIEEMLIDATKWKFQHNKKGMCIQKT